MDLPACFAPGKRRANTPRDGILTFVLLDNSLDEDQPCFLYQEPLAIVCARDAAEIGAALAALEAARGAGHHAAGWFSYELGYALEPRLLPLLPAAEDRRVPLLWFGIFDRRRTLTSRQARQWLEARSGPHTTPTISSVSLDEADYLQPLRLSEIDDLRRRHLSDEPDFQGAFSVSKAHRSASISTFAASSGWPMAR